MAGVVRYPGGVPPPTPKAPPTPDRMGPVNKQGQPLTPYEISQQNLAKAETYRQQGQQNFNSAANHNANYETSYTDPQTGQTMHYKPGVDMSGLDSFMQKYGPKTGSATLSMTQSPAERVTLDTGAINAADAAAYGRAKDQVGASTQGLLKSIQNQFGSRGLRGSSMEGRAAVGALEAGQGQLADTSREQAIQAGNRAVDLAKTSYTGNITQRGQDMDQQQAQMALQAQYDNPAARMQSVLGLLSAYKNLNTRY